MVGIPEKWRPRQWLPASFVKLKSIRRTKHVLITRKYNLAHVDTGKASVNLRVGRCRRSESHLFAACHELRPTAAAIGAMPQRFVQLPRRRYTGGPAERGGSIDNSPRSATHRQVHTHTCTHLGHTNRPHGAGPRRPRAPTQAQPCYHRLSKAPRIPRPVQARLATVARSRAEHSTGFVFGSPGGGGQDPSDRTHLTPLPTLTANGLLDWSTLLA